MPRHSKPGAEYPKDWPAIAEAVKRKHGYKCERCGHPNEPGHVLTVHHLDMDPSNCADWNLAALCQQCHLHIQAKLDLDQGWLFPLIHSAWFVPHLRGFQQYVLGEIES
jgi:5-methylcytosine-specific restriction endonuclease McrA